MASSLPAASFINDSSSTISDTAERSRQLLLCCQENFGEETRRIAGTQLSRFNLWASNIGVFSSRHASLDYRLRTAPAVKAAVNGNLEILCTHLLSALAGQEELPDEVLDAFAEASRKEVPSFGLKLFRQSLSAVAIRISALMLVESTIDTLHQLSLAIRRASNRNSLTRVPSLYDTDGAYFFVRELQESSPASGTPVPRVRFEATPGFEDFLRRILKSRWLKPDENAVLDQFQKDYRQLMFERCVGSISVRRRQLAYFQSHQAKLATPAAAWFVPTAPKPAKPSAQPTRPAVAAQLLSPSNVKGPDSQQPAFQEVVDDAVSETVGSEFQFTSFRPSLSIYAPSSGASSSDAGGLGIAGPFEVPPAPELGPSDKDQMCPYCCLVYPAKTFSLQKKARRWKKHLLEDLQPYICLFKNCNQRGKTYRSFKEWQAHLSPPHDQEWRCPLSHPGVDTVEEQALLFDTAAQFREHLTLCHPDLDPSSSVLHGVFHTARRPAVLPQWCFVCLAEQTTVISLQRHLANHLEQAFLLALPGRDDIKDSDAVSSGLPSSRTAPNDATEPQETDLPDLRGLYADDIDVSTDGAAQTLSAEDFMARISAIDIQSALTLGRLDTWRSEQSAVYDFVGVEDPRLSKSWRVLVLVVIFTLRLRNTNRTTLLHAAAEGQEAVVKLLLERGAEIEAKDKDGQTALSWAAANGHEAVVKLLLERGAEIEAKNKKDGQTALSWAAANGHEAVVKLLLERGAEIEAKDNYDGQTALSWAAANGHEAVVKLLLERGAEIEAKDRYGQTALSWAAANGHEAVVKLLLERGAEIEAKDNIGQTALSWAAANGHEAVVKLLLERGAEIEAKDNSGRTALSWAAGNGHEAVVKLLQHSL